MTTYLVMLGGWAVISAIIAYGVPKVERVHVAAAVILACCWFGLCLVYLG